MPMIKDLEPALKINKHALDEALIQQPQLFYETTRGCSQANATRERTKFDLEVATAELDAQLRKAAAEAGEKSTDKAIASQLEVTPRIKKLKVVYMDAKDEAARWEALKESFQMRSYALKDLAALYVANYYATETGGRARGSAQDITAERVKADVAKLRRRKRGDMEDE